MKRGQSLVELAITLPLLATLAFGGVALARLAVTQARLDAATAAAAAAAARQPSSDQGAKQGRTAFEQAQAGYPLASAAVSIAGGAWTRGGTVRATGSASFDFGLPALPGRVLLKSRAAALIEPYRSHPPSPSAGCRRICFD